MFLVTISRNGTWETILIYSKEELEIIKEQTSKSQSQTIILIRNVSEI